MKYLWVNYIQLILLLTTLYDCPGYAQPEQAPKSVIKTEIIGYTAGGISMKGYLAYDEKQQGQRPGILVVHEWWGHNEYARKRARMLAQLGYTALAIDMYGDGKTAEHPEDARKFAGEALQNFEIAKVRFTTALEKLRQHATTNPAKIAAIGYCFGGGVVLHMARLGVELAGVVSFHGSLVAKNPAEKGKVKARILVCHGAKDNFISPQTIDNFQQEMKNAAVDFKFISYPEAKHSFTNPDADKYKELFKLPIAYNANADKQSWDDMQDFFKKIFIR